MMVHNMHNIDQLLVNGEASNEEFKRGLSKEQIRKLKLFTYTSVKPKGDEDVCSICLVGAAKGDRVYQLVCNHLFHQKCINPWFEKSTVCPNCRRDLDPNNQLPDLPRLQDSASLSSLAAMSEIH